jgi:GT2 family glycosyltransferase
VDLSIVVVSHNTCSFLDACLISLKPTLNPTLEFEVIVVDNASTDGSAEMVSRNHPEVKVVRSDVNLGFSAANNLGIRLAGGRNILFLNPDTIVSDGTLETMRHFVAAHPDAGAATCFVALSTGKLDDAAHRGFPTPWNALCHFSGISRLGPRSRALAGYTQGWKGLGHSHEIDALCGCFMWVRREAGDEVGWWDEDYFFYGDDLDFCYRLRLRGWKIYFVPDATIVHYKGTSSGIRSESAVWTTASVQTRVQATHHRFQAMRIFYSKHLRARYPRIVTTAVYTSTYMLERLAVFAIRRRAAASNPGERPQN